MNNEQAIDRLRKISEKTPIRTNGDDLVAITMAIQTLSQEPICDRDCEHCTWTECPIEPCDDAISRNQSNACSILDDECPYPHKHCWECPLNYQYELAKHELDKNVDLPPITQKSGKWIPVSERLPEKSDRYLAYIVNRHDDKLQYIMTCDYSVDGYWNWFPDDESASDNVVAWMPLPKPYEPQESEEQTDAT